MEELSRVVGVIVKIFFTDQKTRDYKSGKIERARIATPHRVYLYSYRICVA
jgi:hypothetical protein